MLITICASLPLPLLDLLEQPVRAVALPTLNKLRVGMVEREQTWPKELGSGSGLGLARRAPCRSLKERADREASQSRHQAAPSSHRIWTRGLVEDPRLAPKRKIGSAFGSGLGPLLGDDACASIELGTRLEAMDDDLVALKRGREDKDESEGGTKWRRTSVGLSMASR